MSPPKGPAGLSAREFALRIRVPVPTVSLWIRSGRMGAVPQTAGGHWRIPAEYVDLYRRGLYPLPPLRRRAA